jgi:hypothetical protein
MKICDCCFHDQEIKSFIQARSTEEGTCECCAEKGHLLELNELLEYFIAFFSIFKYNPKNGVAIEQLIQDDWDIFVSKEVCEKILIDSFLKVEIAITLDIFEPAISGAVDVKVSYIDEIDESVAYWGQLKDDLKWRRRYLTDIDQMIELGWDSLFNDSYLIDGSTMLYRARINGDGQTDSYKPIEMLSPPVEKTTAGRANPQGIPYLYLSTDPKTTLYETRASYLDNITVGEFQIKEGTQLKIVDFTNNQSTFNHTDNMIQFVTGQLLRRAISVDLSKPLRRYDSELEYIPTQFICEFIRYITKVDGIQFNSSLRKDGTNIVLFNQESIVCTNVELHQITNIEIGSDILS